MKPQRTPLARIGHAFLNSKDGLVAIFKSEAAFRQELMLFIILLPPLFFLPISIEFKLLLFSANCLILITELLNTGIEIIVDIICPDFDEEAKKAKDIGSAAVFISLLLSSVLWIYALFTVLA